MTISKIIITIIAITIRRRMIKNNDYNKNNKINQSLNDTVYL